jgi:hypothetical protein
VKKRVSSQAPVDPPSSATATQDQALNLLADLSRDIPLNHHNVAPNGSAQTLTRNGQSRASADRTNGAPSQLTQLQMYGSSEYIPETANVSPHHSILSLPPAQLSNEPAFQLSKF